MTNPIRIIEIVTQGPQGPRGADGGISDGDKGDILVSNDGAQFLIEDGVVNTTKLQNFTPNTILGRKAGDGHPNLLSAADVREIINVEDDADKTDFDNVRAAGGVTDADYLVRGEILVGLAPDSANGVAGGPQQLGRGPVGYVLKVNDNTDVGLGWEPESGGISEVTGGDGITVTNGTSAPTVGVSNNGITKNKLHLVSDTTPSLTALGSAVEGGDSYDGFIQLNCSTNGHGVRIKSPPHVAAADYTLVLPPTDGQNDQVLKTDGSGNLDWVNQSGGSGMTGGGNDEIFLEAENTMDTNFTTTTNKNYLSVGPLNIQDNIELTVTEGSVMTFV